MASIPCHFAFHQKVPHETCLFKFHHPSIHVFTFECYSFKGFPACSGSSHFAWCITFIDCVFFHVQHSGYSMDMSVVTRSTFDRYSTDTRPTSNQCHDRYSVDIATDIYISTWKWRLVDFPKNPHTKSVCSVGESGRYLPRRFAAR